MACTEEKVKQVEAVEEPTVVVVAMPTQNDSSDGLARMYADLAPEALRVRSAACFLLGVSMFMCGSLEGFMGIIAACTILCCAAPGSLGTAYAARCARVAALLAAGFGAVHLVALSLFSVAVLPEVPPAAAAMCDQAGQAGIKFVPTEASNTLPITTASAQAVASVASHAARRLDAVFLADGDAMPTPPSTVDAAHCERMTRFFKDVAPSMLLMAATFEAILVIAAMRTARACARLLQAARQYGANAL